MNDNINVDSIIAGSVMLVVLDRKTESVDLRS